MGTPRIFDLKKNIAKLQKVLYTSGESVRRDIETQGSEIEFMEKMVIHLQRANWALKKARNANFKQYFQNSGNGRLIGNRSIGLTRRGKITGTLVHNSNRIGSSVDEIENAKSLDINFKIDKGLKKLQRADRVKNSIGGYPKKTNLKSKKSSRFDLGGRATRLSDRPARKTMFKTHAFHFPVKKEKSKEIIDNREKVFKTMNTNFARRREIGSVDIANLQQFYSSKFATDHNPDKEEEADTANQMPLPLISNQTKLNKRCYSQTDIINVDTIKQDNSLNPFEELKPNRIFQKTKEKAQKIRDDILREQKSFPNFEDYIGEKVSINIVNSAEMDSDNDQKPSKRRSEGYEKLRMKIERIARSNFDKRNGNFGSKG